eukprot:CAMPEP_0116971526 /NCGR_PEP_ID=MMETSP0467-20121206/53242_1 /TAXON_ID=283647 /ORGANISM="Mesodinium pulex, Strain SPMC105" /LENGTH=133 /DNA_ID=CAMNT_0004662729 /DNA_START=134 /DNA_END=535 /DNA_ORIENTATION=-
MVNSQVIFKVHHQALAESIETVFGKAVLVTVHGDGHQIHDGLTVLAADEESLGGQLEELVVHVFAAVCVDQQFVVVAELEGTALEFEHFAAREDFEHEAEIDVQHVAELVEHDVGVVPVLDAQQLTHDGIPRK